MRCYRCGAELSLTQRRCPSCGATQPAAAIPAGVVQVPTARTAARQVGNQVAKSGYLKYILIALAVILVAACCLVVAGVLVWQFADLPITIPGIN